MPRRRIHSNLQNRKPEGKESRLQVCQGNGFADKLDCDMKEFYELLKLTKQGDIYRILEYARVNLKYDPRTLKDKE